METRRIWTPSAFWFRFALFWALFVLPFVEHLIDWRYPFLRSEVAISLLLAAAGCSLLAWLTRPSYLFYTALVAVVAFMLVPHTQPLHPRLLETDPIWLLTAGLAVLGALSYWMREKLAVTLLVFLSASFVAGSVESLLGPPLIEVRDSERPGMPSRSTGGPRHVIYLILDEYAGPAGFPEDVAASRQAVNSIRDTFVPRGFTVYENAFSHYAATANAIPSLLDLKLLDEDLEADTGSQGGQAEFKIFTHFKSRGYAVHLYELRGPGYFGAGAGAERTVDYDVLSLGTATMVPFSLADRMWLVTGTHAARNKPLHLAAKNIYPRFTQVQYLWWAQPISLRILEMLQDDILTAQQDTLFLAHLVAPHFSWVYRADGTSRPLSEIVGTPMPTQPEHPLYQVRHAQYAEQVQYLNQRLGEFLDELAAHQLLDSSTLVLHGDHGSRIMGRGGKGSSSRALLESFSTFAAVRKPGSHNGRWVRQKGSLITFLKKELYPEEPWNLPDGLDAVYYPQGEGGFGAIPFLRLWSEDDKPDQTRG